MTEKEILKNAPHGTYHYYSKSNVYLDDICCGYWSGEKKRFLQAQPEGEVRSLKDIDRIVELENLLAKARGELNV